MDESEDETEQDDPLDANKALKDILRKVNVLPGLEKQLNAITQSMSVLSEKYDTLLAEHEQSKVKIAKLEKNALNTQNKCVYLEKCNISLQQRIEEFEQATRKHKIEIVGVEQLPDENVLDIVAKVGRAMDVGCTDVAAAARTRPPRPGGKPAPIVVEFHTAGTQSRDRWLAQRRKLTDITSGDIVGGTTASKIFVNEDLTRASRALLYNTKKNLRGIYKYIWVSKGKILVKESDESNALWIKSENDISELVGAK